MDRLTPHVTISVLGHLVFSILILRKFVPHELENLRGLFEHHELEYVHIVVEVDVEVLLPLQVNLLKGCHVVALNGQFHLSDSLLLQSQGCLSLVAWVHGVACWVSTLGNETTER